MENDIPMVRRLEVKTSKRNPLTCLSTNTLVKRIQQTPNILKAVSNSGSHSGNENRIVRKRDSSLIASVVVEDAVNPSTFTSVVPRKRTKLSTNVTVKSTLLYSKILATSLQNTKKCEDEIIRPKSSVELAIYKGKYNPLRIGDFSKEYLLPLNGHGTNKYKEISMDILAQLMDLDGVYRHKVESFTLVDTRSPDQYKISQIRGALNYFTEDQIFRKFLAKPPKHSGSVTSKRTLLIFYGGSSEESPRKLCEFLRFADRQVHRASFPTLHFPELYVLREGYQSFFENFPLYCYRR